MQDSWTDRLSEYLDGELDDAEQAALARHLDECAACRTVLAELRDVTAIAAGAPATAPADDLWPGIAARIGAQGAVVPLPTRRRVRFSFTMPQLAAAALVLMALSGGAVWLATGGTDAPAPTAAVRPAPTGAAPTAVLVGTEGPGYQGAIAELEQALESSRTRLDPTTVAVLERSLASIDRAIEDARIALQRDPANPYLHRHLDGAMRMKMEILRRAVTVRRAGT